MTTLPAKRFVATHKIFHAVAKRYQNGAGCLRAVDGAFSVEKKWL
jgi:hypothetical protein